MNARNIFVLFNSSITPYFFLHNDIMIEYGIFGEGSQISTNQKLENGAFSLLIALYL